MNVKNGLQNGESTSSSKLMYFVQLLKRTQFEIIGYNGCQTYCTAIFSVLNNDLRKSVFPKMCIHFYEKEINLRECEGFSLLEMLVHILSTK